MSDLDREMERFERACRNLCGSLDSATTTLNGINADLREIKSIAADLARHDAMTRVDLDILKRRHSETFEAAAGRRGT